MAERYDAATVETWLVTWSAPEERLLLDLATIGEIRRADGAFVAEPRGPMHRLDEERGRLYRATCSADLGDAKCRVDLTLPAFTAQAAVLRSDVARRQSACVELDRQVLERAGPTIRQGPKALACPLRRGYSLHRDASCLAPGAKPEARFLITQAGCIPTPISSNATPSPTPRPAIPRGLLAHLCALISSHDTH